MAILQLPDGTFVEIPDPKPAERTVGDKLAVGASGLAKGALGLGASVAEAGVLGATDLFGIDKLLNAVTGGQPGGDGPIRQGFSALKSGIDSLGASPQTVDEKYIDSIARGVSGGAALPFGGIGPSVAYGALAGAGGEAGEQAFGGDSTMGRILGSILPVLGTSAGLAGSRKLFGIGNAQELADVALTGVNRGEATGANLTLAQSLANQGEGNAIGIPGTVAQNLVDSPEALAVQEALLASNNAPRTTALINSQPQRALSTLTEYVSKLPGEQTSVLAASNRAAKAATAKIARVERAPGMAFRKVIEAAPPARIPERGYTLFERKLNELIGKNPEESFADQAAYVLAEVEKRLKPQPATGKGTPGLLGPDGKPISAASANATPGYDALQLKTIVDESVDKFPSKVLGQGAPQRNANRAAASIKDELTKLFEVYAPSVNKANSTASAVREKIVTPIKKSATGKVAGRAGAREDTNAAKTAFDILDTGTPVAGNAGRVPRSDILTLARDLNKTDPKAFPELVVTNIGKHVSDATRRSDGQLSPTFLGEVYENLYGTATKKQGFKEQLIGIARAKKLPDDTFYPGFDRVLRAMQRASQRPAKVSGVTAEGAQATSEANKLSNVMRAFGFVPFQTAARGVEKYYSAKTFQELDRVFSDPKGIQLLRELAKKDPLGPAGQTAIRTYLNETVQEEQ